MVTLRPAASRAVAVPVTGFVGSGPGGAGPVGVVVKISHRLGIHTKRSCNTPPEPEVVLGLDGVGHTPPPDPEGSVVDRGGGQVLLTVITVVVGEGGGGGDMRVARRWGTLDVAERAWEIFGRCGGSEALMDGAVVGLTVTVTGGLSVDGSGVERSVEPGAAALIFELVPFHAMGALDTTVVGGTLVKTRGSSDV